MKRREFIKYGACGLAAIATGGLDLPPLFPRQAQAAAINVSLSMEAALVEMIDLTQVPMWLFQAQGQPLPSFPGPVIFATSGQTITVNVTNNLNEQHAFAIPRLGRGVTTGPIPASPVRRVTPAPSRFKWGRPAPISITTT